jgi:transposase
MRALLAADIPVRQVNPFKLRQFARASGVLAKSDPLDARMIASRLKASASCWIHYSMKRSFTN